MPTSEKKIRNAQISNLRKEIAGLKRSLGIRGGTRTANKVKKIYKTKKHIKQINKLTRRQIKIRKPRKTKKYIAK